MTTTNPSTFKPSTFQLLSFDIYGTLIDWETGITNALSPLLTRVSSTHEQHINNTTQESQQHFLLMQYITIEHEIQIANPTLPYPKVLAQVYRNLAESLNVSYADTEAVDFGASIGTWPPFPDTIAAMQSLGKRYKLVALSNVDNDSFARTRSGPLADVAFDAVYTAQDIGSYKPDLRNYQYLIDHAESEFGVAKDKIWTVAVALKHDHVPSRKIGLRPGVWIKRNSDKVPVSGNLEDMGSEVDLSGVFVTLGEFAAAVEENWDA